MNDKFAIFKPLYDNEVPRIASLIVEYARIDIAYYQVTIT